MPSVLVAALLVLLTLLAAPMVQAQDRGVPSLPALPSELVPLLDRDELRRGFERERDDGRETQVMRPAPGPQEPVELSDLERGFSERAGAPLRLIGRRSFGAGRGVALRQTGAAPDAYMLGVGDEIVVVLRGQVSRTVRARVGRDGTVVVADLPPVPAAGVRLGVFREALQAQVEATYAATEAFANLGELRQISVLVNGEVGNPGAVGLNSLASVIDALHLAGGVRATGSLRNVQVLRGAEVLAVDLYDLVLGRPGPPGGFGIADGDRVFVPVIGATVAVAGEVKRPGVFELGAGVHAATATELLELAGGTMGRGPFSFQLLRRLADGRDDLVELGRPGGQAVRDGDILLVQPTARAPSGRIELAGHVRAPRAYPLSSARTVRQLLRSPAALLPDPYLPFAVVQSGSPSAARRFSAFDLGAVLDGATDVRLGDDDKVYVLGMEHLAFLASEGVGEALRGEVARELRACGGIQYLARWIRGNPRSELASGRFSRAARDLVGGTERCPDLFADVPELLVFVMEHAVLVRGNVLRPGIYPVAEPGRTEAALAAAGARGSGVDLLGATGQARQGGVVVVDEPSVSLHGHVRFAGTRSLRSTPTLRDLVGDLSVFRDDPYLLFGVVSRLDPRTLSRRIVLFSPAEVMAGRSDERLFDRDEVQVFGYSEVRRILAEHEGRPARAGAWDGRDRARGMELAGEDRRRDGSGWDGLGHAEAGGWDARLNGRTDDRLGARGEGWADGRPDARE
ncbi:MAG: SLBB domain-containing protein, partial [Alphaproteobacteria bacterium]